MMTRIRIIAWFSSAVLCAACFDFVGPPVIPIAESPPVFELSVHLNSDDMLHVNGYLAPGVDAQGRQRLVTRDTLFIMDRAVPGDSSIFEWEHLFRMDTIWPQLSELRIEAPRVAGFAAQPPVHFARPLKQGADTLRSARTADVLLPFTFQAPAETIAVRWSLSALGSNSAVQLTGNGSVISGRIPAGWLEQVSDSVFSVSLVISQSTRTQVNEFLASYTFNTFIHWTLVVQ
jgi:hypothetical protein